MGAGGGRGGGCHPLSNNREKALGEGMRVVLVPKLLAAPLPDKGAAVPVNDRHSVEETKAGEHVDIGQTYRCWRAPL